MITSAVVVDGTKNTHSSHGQPHPRKLKTGHVGCFFRVACSFAHREKLIAEVEAILKVGAPQEESATPFTRAAVALISDIRAAHDRAGQLQLADETPQGDSSL